MPNGNPIILAVDIGNTTISIALLQKLRVKKSWDLKTHLPAADLKQKLKKINSEIKRIAPRLSNIVICSVVPQIVPFIKKTFHEALKVRPKVLGQNFSVPIKNLYRDPREVGQDRLVCAYATKKLYGAPAIVVDFGTAITFDIVSAKGDYLGGAIVPGFRLFVESLFEKTALLPKVKIHSPREIIGRDTEASILSGLFYGYSALCNGMIQILSSKMKKRPRVIITGGYAPLIKKFFKDFDAIDSHLIFKGLALLAA